MTRKHIIFSGRVQGVGFRWRAKKAAQLYSCTGWVRNDWKGTVTMEVQGTEEQINMVLDAINRGMYIQIDNMESRTIPVDSKLPKPEFYMLYTGDAKHTEEELSLADVYWNGENSNLDLKVKVLYGNDQHTILSQYVQFTQIYKQKSRELGKNREAVLATLKECKEKDILKDYLETREAEVIGIMMALYDKDSYMKLHDNRKEKEGGIKTLASLVKKGLLSLTNAAKEANMTEKDFAKETGLEVQS